jgi:anti-sigma B factor antagonist
VTLSFQDRWVGDVAAVVTCSGRIVEGPEVEALERHVIGLTSETRNIVLHVGGVNFLDSSGIGLLVRLHARLQNIGGGLSLCAVPPKMRDVLSVTRLERILQAYESEAEAVAATFRPPYEITSQGGPRTILCVDPSADVLAYVRELLRSDGYMAVCASNLADALTLLIATQPRAVVLGPGLPVRTATGAGAAFAERAAALPVIELSGEFASDEAGHAGRQLLEQVKALVGLSDTSSPGAIT